MDLSLDTTGSLVATPGWRTVQGADFIEQHVLPVLYPAGLTEDVQVVLGSLLVAINVVVYSWMWRSRFKGLRAALKK